jgi:hypothetical protein
MDPITVSVGVVVLSWGADVALAPKQVVHTVRGASADVDPALDRTRRTFGVVATLLEAFAVAVGIGIF